MNSNSAIIFRLLGGFWLNELQQNDLEIIASFPDLQGTIPDGVRNLSELAVEYQRLFGFNLPPYESAFLDPSGMLNAPATARVQRLYRQAGWEPEPEARTGAPDHIGLELRALADWMLVDEQRLLVERLWGEHLALWAPVFLLTLQRLQPLAFYRELSEISLEIVLELLPENGVPRGGDPFPALPPAPVYRASLEPLAEDDESYQDGVQDQSQQPGEGAGLKKVLRRMLIPCEAGLYITRQDIARIGLALELPGVMGERFHMLKTLFELSAQYDLLPKLLQEIDELFGQVEKSYLGLEAEYPLWQIYGKAWRTRLRETRAALDFDAAA